MKSEREGKIFRTHRTLKGAAVAMLALDKNCSVRHKGHYVRIRRSIHLSLAFINIYSNYNYTFT